MSYLLAIDFKFPDDPAPNSGWDAVYQDDKGAWVAQFNPETGKADPLTGPDGKRIPAPQGWQKFISEEL